MCQCFDFEIVFDMLCQDVKLDVMEIKFNYMYCVGMFVNGGFESLLQSWQVILV